MTISKGRLQQPNSLQPYLEVTLWDGHRPTLGLSSTASSTVPLVVQKVVMVVASTLPARENTNYSKVYISGVDITGD